MLIQHHPSFDESFRGCPLSGKLFIDSRSAEQLLQLSQTKKGNGITGAQGNYWLILSLASEFPHAGCVNFPFREREQHEICDDSCICFIPPQIGTYIWPLVA